ncbi:MAG: hypothetical protein ACLUVF_04110 [Adlercreutzia sp.]
MNATVQTPAGPAKVVDHDVPREIVSLKVEGEQPVKVPLSEFDPAPEGATRPNAVGEEAWGEATSDRGLIGGEALIFSTSQFTGADKLAEGAKVRHTGGSRKGSGRRGARAAAAPRAAGAAARARRGRRRRLRHRPPARKRRRSTKLSAADDGRGLEPCPPPRGGRARRGGRIAEAAPSALRDGLAAQGRRAPQGRRPQPERPGQSGRPGESAKGQGLPGPLSLRPGRRQAQGRLAAAGPEVLGAAGRAGRRVPQRRG